MNGSRHTQPIAFFTNKFELNKTTELGLALADLSTLVMASVNRRNDPDHSLTLLNIPVGF